MDRTRAQSYYCNCGLTEMFAGIYCSDFETRLHMTASAVLYATGRDRETGGVLAAGAAGFSALVNAAGLTVLLG